jgi:hypothetical protein
MSSFTNLTLECIAQRLHFLFAQVFENLKRRLG